MVEETITREACWRPVLGRQLCEPGLDWPGKFLSCCAAEPFQSLSIAGCALGIRLAGDWFCVCHTFASLGGGGGVFVVALDHDRVQRAWRSGLGTLDENEVFCGRRGSLAVLDGRRL
jgi:hypothetical protein